MHERKALMAERADAFLALPGGIGTYEELFEMWAWQQLGYHNKPVGLLNCAGFYDGLLTFLQSSAQAGLISESQIGALRTDTSPDELLTSLRDEAMLKPVLNVLSDKI